MTYKDINLCKGVRCIAPYLLALMNKFVEVSTVHSVGIANRNCREVSGFFGDNLQSGLSVVHDFKAVVSTVNGQSNPQQQKSRPETFGHTAIICCWTVKKFFQAISESR